MAGPGLEGGDQGGLVFLALMLAVTLGGIFIVSSLIGVITTGLENKIAVLRKGRSRIVERDHTVVLGWSEQIFTVVSELVQANQSNRRSCVAILADKDKAEMDDASYGVVLNPPKNAPVTLTGKDRVIVLAEE